MLLLLHVESVVALLLLEGVLIHHRVEHATKRLL